MSAKPFVIAAVALSLFAQTKTIPKSAYAPSGMTDVDPESVKIGESVCVFPFHNTKEGHAWVSRTSFYQSSAGCSFTAVRAKHGWALHLNGIKIHPANETDRDCLRYGWIQMTEVYP